MEIFNRNKEQSSDQSSFEQADKYASLSQPQERQRSDEHQAKYDNAKEVLQAAKNTKDTLLVGPVRDRMNDYGRRAARAKGQEQISQDAAAEYQRRLAAGEVPPEEIVRRELNLEAAHPGGTPILRGELVEPKAADVIRLAENPDDQSAATEEKVA